jgi:hypothetical protein
MIEAPPEPGHCCECGDRIPASESEVILTFTPNAAQLHFHANCALPAYRAAVMEPEAWVFTYRRIDAEQN